MSNIFDTKSIFFDFAKKHFIIARHTWEVLVPRAKVTKNQDLLSASPTNIIFIFNHAFPR